MKKQKRSIAFSKILVQAMTTDKVLFKAMRKGSKQTKALLARRGYALSAAGEKQLDVVVPGPKPKPNPPPPPPWEVLYPMANAILTELSARIDQLENAAKKRNKA